MQWSKVCRQAVLACGLWFAACYAPVVVAGVDTYEFGQEADLDRYNTFIEELRCPKCKNQNLSGSNSPIAKDLRRELHRLITEGKEDQQIIDFMVSRYGDFVLYRPPLQKNTYVLWIAPGAMLILGLLILGFIVFKRSRTPKASTLTDGEQEQLDTFLKTTLNASESSSKTPTKK